MAQPSLSRQIRDLEAEIGVQLLERTAKSVRLTDAGRAFLEEARAILKHADDAVLKVRFWPNRFPLSQSLRSPVSESYLSRDLFHHRVHIGEVPDLGELAVFEAIKSELRNGHPTTGRLNSLEGPPVGAGDREVPGNIVAVDNEVPYLPVPVGNA